ncbi:MAG TPA: protein kinase [Vicinamibacterales bacterium]|nr:protein kinase [Vicinamibacterales bacterium]
MNVDLLRTAERIADGQVEAWPASPSSPAPDSPDLSVELGIIASIAREYRRLNDESAATTETASFESRRWGHLEVFEEIGRGGYGTVYRAHDTQLDREVALKLYRAGSDTARVIDEGRKLAKVRHPNVVTVYGADVVDGVAGIWMEYIRGRSLGHVIRTSGPMSAGEATAIGLELAGALAAVHHAGLVHRDVKAQNIMREEGGRIVLMDLGASAVSAPAGDVTPRDVIGTPDYMAPELFDYRPASRQSDIYGLGVLLFFLVTGELPIQAATLDALRNAHRARATRSLRDVRPDLPQAFVAVVTRMLAPDPADRFATTGDLEEALSAVVRPQMRAATRTSVAAWLLAAAATLFVLTAAYNAFVRFRGAPVDGGRPVVAVMPVENLTGDPSMNYVAEALTQVLIADLASLQTILVPSYDAVAPFRDPTLAAASVADRLRARLLLRASISSGGDRLRMTVALIDPVTNSAIWGETFTRDRKDTLATQAEVAGLVAAKLSLEIGASAKQALEQRPVSAEAQDEYLRGLAAAASPADARQQIALGHFQRAVALAPDFAAAWAALADARLRVANTSSFATRNSEIEQVRHDALEAIRLNAAEARGYGALAVLQFYYDWDFRAAERSFQRALEINPSLPQVRQRYSTFLASQGRLDEAIAEAQAARELESSMPQRIVLHAFAYYYRRDYERALKEMESALAIDANYPVAHFGIGRIVSAMGDQARAIREINFALAGASNTSWLFELARVYTVAGLADDAARVVAQIESRRATDNVGASIDQYGYMLAAAGRIDEAFAALNTAVDNRVENILWIKVDPRADPLRSDPRFQALLRRIGL